MTIPERIPIAYVPDFLHTNTIGRYDGGQFFGFVASATPPESFWQRRVWQAVLHHFDRDGVHLRSDLWTPGKRGLTDRPGIDLCKRRLDEWLTALPGRVFGDIAIRPFRVEIDGVVYGLVEMADEDGHWAELIPNDLGFYPPWDGLYDT